MMPLWPLGVHAVYMIPVKGKGGARFHCGFDDHAYQFLYGHGALGNPGILHALPIALFPFLAPVILQRIALYRKHLVGAQQMPVAFDIVPGGTPEQIGIAHGGEDVVCLAPVVAVVGAQLKKIQYILVPYVQIHGHGSLPHAQLIYRHGGIVGQLDPADYAAGGAGKAPYGGAARPHFSEIQPHASAKLGDLCKVVYAAVNAVQRIGHRVYKAAGELMIRLPGICHGGGGHGHLQPAQNVIKPFRPKEAVFFPQGQVHGDAHVHFLGCFNGLQAAGLYHIAF